MNKRETKLYSYNLDFDLRQQVKSAIEDNYQLIELENLEELLVWTTSGKQETLLLQEGGLSPKQIEELQLVLKSSPQVKVIVFGEGENLQWCVEVLKNAQVRLENVSRTREEWMKLFPSEKPAFEKSDERFYMEGLIHHAIKRGFSDHLSLKKATAIFEKDFLNQVLNLFKNDAVQTSQFLGVPVGRVKG